MTPVDWLGTPLIPNKLSKHLSWFGESAVTSIVLGGYPIELAVIVLTVLLIDCIA